MGSGLLNVNLQWLRNVLTNDSIYFLSHAYIRQPFVYCTMIMSFLRKRHGSDFDCLNYSLSYISLNLRNQFRDACTSPYKFRLSFNTHS
jgi:hypothetical protein